MAGEEREGSFPSNQLPPPLPSSSSPASDVHPSAPPLRIPDASLKAEKMSKIAQLLRMQGEEGEGEVRRMLCHAIHLSPSLTHPWKLLGQTLSQDALPATASIVFENVIALAPAREEAPARIALATALAQQGRVGQAIETLLTAVARSSGDSTTTRVLQELLLPSSPLRALLPAPPLSPLLPSVSLFPDGIAARIAGAAAAHGKPTDAIDALPAAT